jgi:hypothetical protein
MPLYPRHACVKPPSVACHLDDNRHHESSMTLDTTGTYHFYYVLSSIQGG